MLAIKPLPKENSPAVFLVKENMNNNQENKKIVSMPESETQPTWRKITIETETGKEEVEVVLIDPNRNRTAFITNVNRSPEDMKTINGAIMQQPWQVEQVAFYDQMGSQILMRMAGNELCVNGIRALAFLILNGKVGQVEINVVSIGQFQAGVLKNEKTAVVESWIQLNIPASEPVVSDILGDQCQTVPMEGISHLTTPANLAQTNDLEPYNQQALEGLSELDLLQSCPAAGVMFYQVISSEKIDLLPVVWVREVETLFAENACGSGTMATIATLLQQGVTLADQIQVTQATSGEVLTVILNPDRKSLRLSGKTNYVK